ncbi:hypothetical protein ACFWPH_00060 [Nocardia sp. NPDC058499]|uniref:hypothetical protein n=1 Tax=Nocardia sp. NPDC058499 TaxID=3346530 RepID=UPI0036503226
MSSEDADRAAEIQHLMRIGGNVIAFITNSADMLNRTYFAINLGREAKVLAWATSTALGFISEAPQEYLDITNDIRKYSDSITQKIEENPEWLELTPDGIPILHATQLIGIWGSLESFVGDIFKASLKYRPELLDGKAFEKINLPVSLIARDSDELYSTIYQRVLPPGSGQIGKLEDVLNMVNLGGPIDANLKKELHSAHQIRNLWAHNAGIADGHFLEQCSYLGYRLGDTVEITADRYKSLTQAIVDYVSVILDRINKRGFV